MSCILVDYQRAFSHHGKLVNNMKEAGIPQPERKLVKFLYWNQYAIVKTIDRKSRRMCILRKVV